MRINFEMPMVLWLLVLNGFFIWIPKKMNKAHSVFYTGLRILVYSLLVLSLSGISFLHETEATHTIFLVDGSDSCMDYQDEFVDYINTQVDEKQDHDYIEMIVFGENVAVEQMMTNSNLEYRPHVLIKRTGTNLASAYKFALNSFDQDKNKRLVVLSDFKETSGALLEEMEDLNNQDIEFKHYYGSGIKGADVQLVNVQAPTNVKQGEGFPITVSVYSNTDTRGTIMLMEDGNLSIQQEVTLKKGMQRYVFQDLLTRPGGHQYEVSIDVPADAYRQNNKWHHVVDVAGPLSILILDPNVEGSAYVELLRSQGVDVTHVTTSNTVLALEQMALYDGLVLINASIETLDRDFLRDLELYIKELGGGLLVIGGDESYAIGGYEETILEQILPVDMALKIEGESYDLSMMVVVDKSGSMASSETGPTKMQMAKEAAIRVAATLSPKDQLGLVAFDNQAHEVLPLTEVRDMDTISDKVASVKADGGTSILPALSMGLKNLSHSNLKGKHLLLLSDGQGEQSGFDILISQYPDVTISTIAIGGNADTRTMEHIANLGNGRFYQVSDYRKIPEIFTKETRLAMDEFIKEGTFVPVKRSHHSMVAEVLQMPLLYGYIGTSPKAQAEMILSIEDDPLLSTWQYGLGKTMAWTSDVNSWSRLYYGQDQGIQLLTDLVSNMVSDGGAKHAEVDVVSHNDRVEISGLLEGVDDVKFEVVNDAGQVMDIKIDRYSDGYFEGGQKVSGDGFYFLRGVDETKGQIIYQTPLALNYSKEYDGLQSQNILESYVAMTGSKSLNGHEVVFSDIAQKTKSQKDYDDLLLVLALILFVLDVACRKLRFDPFQRIMIKKQQAKTRVESEFEVATEAEKKTDEIMVDQSKASEDVIDTGRLLSKVRKRE